MRIPFLPSLAAASAWMILAASAAMGRSVDLRGRLLDPADRAGIPGARVLIAGTATGAFTDSAGRFRLQGEVAVRPVAADGPHAPVFRDGALWISASREARARIEWFSIRGEGLGASASILEPGPNRVDALRAAPRDFSGYVRIRAEGRAWVMRALRLPGPVPADWMGEAAPAPLAKAAEGGILQVTMDGLLPKEIAFDSDAQDLGDFAMEYPARGIGVGAAPPYGATVLFDGSRGRAAAQAELQAKWRDWPRFTPSEIRFRIVRDPESPGDTGRVALQSCCNPTWGYDDIQATVGLYRDCQIHVEWIAMGEYDDPYDAAAPDANASDPAGAGQKGYVNSGVYAASRYEVQIQSWDTAAAKLPGLHDMGAIVDDEAPAANRNRPNGVWQAYDITFRGARFDGTSMSEPPIMSVWWNGAKVHGNRKLSGAAAGLANHSGEEHNDTAVYGLKLQSEGRDVRFRNVWIKRLDLAEPNTDVGY